MPRNQKSARIDAQTDGPGSPPHSQLAATSQPDLPLLPAANTPAPVEQPPSVQQEAEQPWQEKPYETSPLENCPPLARYLALLTYDKDGLGAPAAGARLYWRSMNAVVIVKRRGKYDKEQATITIDAATGELTWHTDGFDAEQLAPDRATAEEIRQALTARSIELPVPTPHSASVRDLPDGPWNQRNVQPSRLYPHCFPDGQISMIVARYEEPNGGKYYLAYTFYSDGKWRLGEPDGLLLPFGLEKLKHATGVCVHEGQKAALGARELAEFESGERLSLSALERAKARKVPAAFRSLLDQYAHIGWHGGAHAAHRTDWSWLERLGVNRVLVATDNDAEGKRSAVTVIAKAVHLPVQWLRFTQQWPPSFDLADDFPQSLYKEDSGGHDVYIGPVPSQLVSPATWMTDVVISGKKPIYRLRPHAAAEWVYVRKQDAFVSRHAPHQRYTPEHFNRAMAPFSHTKKLADLVLDRADMHVDTLVYRPGEQEEVATDSGHAFNSYRGGGLALPATQEVLEPQALAPWSEYLTYLLPEENDRHEVERWIATLVARPQTRMKYGVLLISSPGTGKSTLGMILAQLIGPHNVSYPNEKMINQNTNTWVPERRLAVVEEVYAGHRWHTANNLKAVMTEKKVRVDEKYIKAIEVEICIHVLATSNHENALAVPNDDRRWLVPRVTSTIWPAHKWIDFYNWLETSGLRAILLWAHEFEGDGSQYVGPGDTAPMTSAKMDLVETSLSEASQLALSLTRALTTGKRANDPWALAVNDVRRVVLQMATVQGLRANDSALDIKKAMCLVTGIHTYDKRLQVDGCKEYLLLNTAAKASLEGLTPVEARARLRQLIVAGRARIQQWSAGKPLEEDM